MSLKIHLIDDPEANFMMAELDADHTDLHSTFDRSEILLGRLLDGIADRADASSLSPWLVLRGGLVAWLPLRSRRWGPIGMMVPIRDGTETRIVYANGPVWPASQPLVLDWILATGSTLGAAVRHVGPVPGSRVRVGVVISCAEGEERLDALGDVDVDLYCFASGRKAKVFHLGFDIGDYAACMSSPARIPFAGENVLP